MALIKIHSDGTFETAAQIEATAAGLAFASKAHELRAVKADLATLRVIGNLTGRLDILRTTLKNAKTPAAKASTKTRIEAVKHKISEQRAKRKFPRLSVIGLHKKAKTVLEALGKKPSAPAVKTARVPKDHGTAFDRKAKLAAGSISRGIRSELRDHGKTALVPVANRASATAPKAVPSSKKADTATTHATKPARGAIGNTLTEIKKIKASIATGTLKGAKLIRAREELEKQREALRGLRAGKTPANQRAIVKVSPAKHMGGAKKIVGKESGMGDAATKPKGAVLNHTVATLTEKLKRLRVKQKETLNKGQKVSLTRLINETKARLAAMKAKAK